MPRTSRRYTVTTDTTRATPHVSTNCTAKSTGSASITGLMSPLTSVITISTGSAIRQSTNPTATATTGSTAGGKRGCMTRWRLPISEVVATSTEVANQVQEMSPANTNTA